MSVLDRPVREFMETDVVTVRPDLPVRSLVEVLEEHRITRVGIMGALAEAAGE